MPARSAPRSRTAKNATKSLPESLVFRSYSTLYFVKSGWAKQKKFVEPLVDAIAAANLWEHLPLLSVGIAAGKPRGALSAVKTTLMSGKSQYSFIDQGKTPYSDETTASLTLEFGSGGLQITTSVRGTVLATLGPRALDDFFSILCSLHDDWGDAAHLASATAWTDWDDNAPAADVSSDWPLRAIADAFEPGRPQEDDDEDDEATWAAAQALAKAKVPSGVTRKSHKGLVLLRWTEDPSDARAANSAATKHESWVKGIVKTEPM